MITIPQAFNSSITLIKVLRGVISHVYYSSAVESGLSFYVASVLSPLFNLQYKSNRSHIADMLIFSSYNNELISSKFFQSTQNG
ncbi:hypothetical protein [Clostridium sp. JN-1]|uniref:hypothetical protein n=1 Tax=Clostridium sp. JN-1 TaxID=2483110 RepID=UPI000F0B2AAC|nr:hypothetical protein [Clostridium sp. JN-1]